MNSFSDDTLQGLRRTLEDEKRTLTARMELLASEDPFNNPDRASDKAASDTEAGNEADHDRAAAIVSELGERVAEIDQALERMADGTYGYCTNCHQPISADRLTILPTATQCLDCETAKEHPASGH